MTTIAPCLTLLTDFGLQDVYVGVMKGVVADIAPTLPVIDLTHMIPPQDLIAARFNMMNAYPYFPAGTVHVVVVDPGVGSARRAIALSLPQGSPPGIIVAPDNGVISGVLAQQSPEAIASMRAVELTCREYWRVKSPSQTFHGRDIFAPVAAHLASGVPLEYVGDDISPHSLVQLPISPATIQAKQLEGTIQYIDQFGNGITTIPSTEIPDTPNLMGRLYTIQGSHVLPVQTTYAAVSIGEGLMLTGSHGWLEVSVNRGSAARQFEMKIGDKVEMPLIVNETPCDR